MRSKFVVAWVMLALLGLLFHPACKTGDDCDFNIVGTWEITLTISGGPSPWIEILTFSGTTTSGTVSGWQYEPGQTGTYTVTDCNTVRFVFEYNGIYGYTYVPFDGTGTGNTMNGTCSYYDDDLGSTYPGSFTGTKL